MKTNRVAKQYCRKVRSWLPNGKMRRDIMAKIENSADEYIQQNPDADYDTIQTQLGLPKDIAASYIESLGTSEVLKNLRIRRRILTIIIVTALAVLLSWTATVTWAIVEVRQNTDAPYIEVTIE